MTDPRGETGTVDDYGGVRFFDGKRGRGVPARMAIVGGRLIVREGAGGTVLSDTPLTEARALDWEPYRWMRVALAEDDDRRLMIENPAAIEALKRACPTLKARRGARREIRQIAIWGGGALASAALLLLVVLPWAAERAAAWVPDDIRNTLGVQIERQVVKILGEPTTEDAPDTAYCTGSAGRAVLARLIAELVEAGGAGTVPDVAVIRSTVPNALALPGDRILLLAPLIEQVEGPNAVAGVLAHELGHVAERHPMRAAIHSIGIGAVVGLLLGDVTGGAIVVTAVETTLSSAYSRDKERAADAYALRVMNALGYDAGGLADFLASLQARHGGGPLPAFLSTHPATGERIAEIEAAATGTGAALSPADWRALQGICAE